MNKQVVYFSDNFFSTGYTDIFSHEQEKIGSLDLKSPFKEGVDVIDLSGNVLVRGKFPFMSNKWIVLAREETIIGELKESFAFFSKNYHYKAVDKGVYKIHSPAFSKQYEIRDDRNKPVAYFKKVNSFFENPSFQLINYSNTIPAFEWIVVIMGIHAIQKRRRSAAASMM